MEIKNKGVITSLTAQQEIAKGNTTAALGAGRIAQLQAELRETKVSQVSEGDSIKCWQLISFTKYVDFL